jgi:poly-gamma-glutamate capsule biosynthesis protein CapA/YwtB (metallophosphatase superfamily)
MFPPDVKTPRRRARALLGAGALALVLLAAGCGSAAEGTPQWRSAPAPAGKQSAAGSSATPSPGGTAAKAKSISLSATGDIVMGNAPGSLPPGNGKDFFAGVKRTLAADLVMGNLEEPLTDDTGRRKCGAASSGCHQFRAPPSYASHLKAAGFELMNQANNHGNDYGPAGYTNTQKALEAVGLQHTGAPGEITVVEVVGVKVGVVGFSSYPWNNSLIDIASAKELIAEAADEADVVVVQVHMGGEGSDKTRVRPGTEIFLGENRGNPIAFAHAVIDAGADLVVGHGPHVFRAMEFYKGRLIAYSMGNFAGGGGTLSRNGVLGYGGVLKVSVTADGDFVSGQLISTNMNSAGKPVTDPAGRAAGLVESVSGKDFPTTGARLDTDGKISPPGS